MRYLAQLKARIAADKVQKGPESELTKPPKPSSVSFVGSHSGASNNFTEVASTFTSSESLSELGIERAAIIEHDAKVPREWAEGYARLLFCSLASLAFVSLAKLLQDDTHSRLRVRIC